MILSLELLVSVVRALVPPPDRPPDRQPARAPSRAPTRLEPRALVRVFSPREDVEDLYRFELVMTGVRERLDDPLTTLRIGSPCSAVVLQLNYSSVLFVW